MEEKKIMTYDAAPWIKYLEVDNETGERKISNIAPIEIKILYRLQGRIFNNFDINIINDDSQNNTKKLDRNSLLTLKNQMYNNLDKYKNSDEIYLTYMYKITKIISESAFESNKNYYPIDKSNNAHWIDKLDAINFLFDFIEGNYIIYPHEVIGNLNLPLLQQKQSEYYKEKYICLEEKEIILKIILKIVEYIISTSIELVSK